LQEILPTHPPKHKRAQSPAGPDEHVAVQPPTPNKGTTPEAKQEPPQKILLTAPEDSKPVIKSPEAY
jgi:hypothetical protein